MAFQHSLMVASRGPLTPDNRSGSTGSTSAAFGVSFTSYGRTEFPTPRSLDEPTFLASFLCSTKDAYGGLPMYTIWSLTACQSKSSTGSVGGCLTCRLTTPSLQECLQAQPATHCLESWCEGGGSQGQDEGQAGGKKRFVFWSLFIFSCKILLYFKRSVVNFSSIIPSIITFSSHSFNTKI